jgi:hypothetical protein
MGAGADRIRAVRKINPSPLGEAVADLLNAVWDGIYHLPDSVVHKTDWTDNYYIAVVVPDHGLATWDFNYLTKLVVLCHDAGLRMQIGTCNPRNLRLSFHQRKTRKGSTMERHPTMEEATRIIRDVYTNFESEHRLPDSPAVSKALDALRTSGGDRTAPDGQDEHLVLDEDVEPDDRVFPGKRGL